MEEKKMLFRKRKTNKTDTELVLEALKEAGIECNEKIEENKPYGNKLLLECKDGSTILVDKNFNIFCSKYN